VTLTPIHEIQGTGLVSPLSGRTVGARGVVVGRSRKGFFVQDPDGPRDGSASSGIFVYHPRDQPPVGAFVEVRGEVVDYVPEETERPTTQLASREVRVLDDEGPRIEPVWLTAQRIGTSNADLGAFLNGVEGMLAGVEAGATFVAPSNPYGDYVVLPPGSDVPRTRHGGVRIDPERPERWLPSFRVTDYAKAPRVHVGARLAGPVVGPLNYRASAFQIAALAAPRVSPVRIALEATALRSGNAAVTVLTLNGFNLDARVEDPSRVNDPRRDVDDDRGDGRFEMLARAVVEQAACPDLVALQEMQDDDGAELSEKTSARKNYAILVGEVQRAGGPRYRWVDEPPLAQDDGGQPGGNIRNAFLYDEARVELLPDSLRRLGEDDAAFAGSRKPLLARFRHRGTRRDLVVVNVHLASKRHQRGLFAPDRPGFDPREPVRVAQARLVRATLDGLGTDVDYYVTGDFNDFEFSETLRTLTGPDGVNLVERVSLDGRYDYNHRGVSQVLMHGIVGKRQAGRADYEILHGNDLIGVQPGSVGDRATDHAYVIARLGLAGG
jgi:predicted extracellular nuclease